MKTQITSSGVIGCCFALIVVLAISMAYAGSEPNINYGLWEVTVKTEMAGMPMQMPTMTNTQCITKENAVPTTTQPDQDCKFIEKKFSGNTGTWRMVCNTDQGEAEATGQITYAGATFKGTIEMSMQGMTMTQKMSGKRLGDCTQ